MFYHIVAFSLGILLDLLIGDPYNLPHPVRWIGSLIGFFRKRFLEKRIESMHRDAKVETFLGFITVVLTVLITAFLTGIVVIFSFMWNPFLGILVEAILTCYCLAAKSLQKESMKVYIALNNPELDKARYAVSMIVGRDTDALDETGIIKATVETIAENTSDGIIAPLFYLFLGGPILGMAYKAVNTMDSMIGYHSDKYEYFGKCAAKLDDIVNFIPARLSAYAMILVAFISKSFNGKEALRIYKRDRFNHKSPNSAQTESVCAGALGIKLAGDASYFGKIVKKPYIGDDNRDIERNDIRKAIKLMYLTENVVFVIFAIVGSVIALLMQG